MVLWTDHEYTERQTDRSDMACTDVLLIEDDDNSVNDDLQLFPS